MNSLLFSTRKLLLILFVLFTSISYSQEEEKIDVPFAILEDIPRFPNCIDDSMSTQEAKQCFNQEMNNHIKMHLKYPREAVKKKIEGRVTVLFIINNQGYIKNIRIKSAVGTELLAIEAERIMKLLPKFKPGMQKGKPVNVSYAQPIMFKLQ